jgi:hypothetical protein
MMWTYHFKKFLEVVFERRSLLLEAVFDSRYESLDGVVGFRPAATIAGHYGKVTCSVLLPLLATLGAFPGAFNGALGGRNPAITGGRSCVT